MATVVEQWWNGRTGTEMGEDVRRDARLCTDGDLWWVELVLGGTQGERDASDPGNEAWARRLLAAALDSSGEWRRVGQ